MKDRLKKSNIISIILIVISVLVIVGITYASFNIDLKGLININANVPSISLTYEEAPSALIQTNKVLSVDEHIVSDNYFEFKVSSTSDTMYDLYYNIYLTEETTNTLSRDNLYIYLTEVTDDGEERLTWPIRLSSLKQHDTYENSYYIIKNKSFIFSTNSKETKEKTYRFRIWNEPTPSDTEAIIEGGIYEYKISVESSNQSVTPDYCFTTSGSSITGYNCWANNSDGYEAITDVVIPSTISGETITTIGNEAFYYVGLKSVVIPNTITSIGDNAFIINELKSVVIPNSVTTIGKEAFAYNNLEYVLINEGSNLIGTTGMGKETFSTINYTKPLTIYNNSGKKFKWYYVTQGRNNSEDETYNFVTGTVPSYTNSYNNIYASVTIKTGMPS